MNLFEKLQTIKKELLESNLKKTGKNKFAGFEYFELADFLPTIIKLCDTHKVFTAVSFDKEIAKLTAINSEKPDEVIVVTSPMEELELKGCNKVQALGGVETYQRRYLYMSLFDITESDMFDSTQSVEKDMKCACCGKAFEDYTTKDGKFYSAETLYGLAIKKYGKAICTACAKKDENGGNK